MRVVVLTDGSTHGVEILRELKARGVALEAILLQGPNQSVLVRLRRALRRYGYRQTAWDTLNFVAAKFKAPREQVQYAAYCRQVYTVADFNSLECVELLGALSPELMILGGAPILKPAILNTAKTVLNAHPGLLPKFRGVDVIAWAILERAPIGVTVHKVDSGIDTGEIFVQEQVPVEVGDTLSSLRHKAELTAARLMAEVVCRSISSLESKGKIQIGASGPLYRRMPRKTRKEVERILRNAPLFS